MEQTKECEQIIRAAKAILVALQCDASQGGNLAVKLHNANPLCVNLLQEALAGR